MAVIPCSGIRNTISQTDKLREQGMDIPGWSGGRRVFFIGVSRRVLSRRHASGNIFVSTAATSRWTSASCHGRHKITWRRIFLAFFQRDYKRVAQAPGAGWVPPGRVDGRAAIRSICEPVFDRPSARSPLEGFSCACSGLAPVNVEISRSGDAQKTLLNIENWDAELYREADLWKPPSRSWNAG